VTPKEEGNVTDAKVARRMQTVATNLRDLAEAIRRHTQAMKGESK
jgi:hypothetical protein